MMIFADAGISSRSGTQAHACVCVFTLILAQLSGNYGPLAAIGHSCKSKTRRYVPGSKSTLHRVIQHTDPEQLQEVLVRYTGGRIKQMPALAGYRKRIRGANRNGDSHFETVTLVEHGSGIPKAGCSFHNANEELDATRQLLSETDFARRVITLDALQATFESVGLIVGA